MRTRSQLPKTTGASSASPAHDTSVPRHARSGECWCGGDHTGVEESMMALLDRAEDERDGWPGSIAAESVTVTWGKETFTPVRFNSFDVGPFSITVARVPGEGIDELRKRAQAHLERVAEEEFDRKLRAHLGRVRRAAEVARENAGRRAGEEPDHEEARRQDEHDRRR